MNPEEFGQHMKECFPEEYEVVEQLAKAAIMAADGKPFPSRDLITLARLNAAHTKLVAVLTHYLLFGENVVPRSEILAYIERVDSQLIPGVNKLKESALRQILKEHQ